MGEAGKPRVLIVEDDPRLSLINRRALESEGYEVEAASSIAGARRALAGGAPDVILLDVKLPDGSGIDFCAEVRGRVGSYIIFLTSVTSSEGELEGLVAGGDDYLRKPYGIGLLRERVKKGLRRERDAQRFVRRGSLTLDVVAARAQIGGRDLLLTGKEFATLLALSQAEGQTLAAEQLYEAVWGRPMAGDPNALRMVVSRLRRKLEPSGHTVSSGRGRGYAFRRPG
jgi:DNA-binding response OmpR family regulator